jgi:hypothetical protein
VIAKEGACQICRSGWYADYPTYGNFMVDLFGAVSIDGNNLGRYDDKKFESFIADAQKETDDTKRGESTPRPRSVCSTRRSTRSRSTGTPATTCIATASSTTCSPRSASSCGRRSARTADSSTMSGEGRLRPDLPARSTILRPS